ncbi:MAG: heavy-metal-associated domain-containing protein [Gemmatimonadota bacterium]
MRMFARGMTAVLAMLALVGLGAPAGLAAQQTEGVQQPAPRQIEVTILGMSCPFCAYGVEQKLKKLNGVEDLDVQLKTGVATLTLEEGDDVSNETLKKTVEDAGFEVAGITRNFDSEYPDVEEGSDG